MTEAAEEQEALHRLRNTFADLDPLFRRISSPYGLKPAPSGAFAEEDRVSHPFRVSHAAATALMSATDHLQAFQLLTNGCSNCSATTMNFLRTAHWSLLRAALENASRAIWILGPDDSSERVARALRVQADNVKNSDLASQKLPSGPLKPRAARLDRVEEIGNQAGLSKKQVTEKIFYLDVVRYAWEFVGADPDRGELFWRACSGSAHGDFWTVVSLQERETLDSADGVATMQLTASIPVVAGVTAEVAAVLHTAFDLFDRRNQVIQ